MHAQILTGSAKTDTTQLAIADPQAFMECDLGAQVQWLTCKAKSYGYANLDNLLGKAPALYTRLAEMWRHAHPLPETSWA
jgi:hypothetical protein